MAVTGGIKFFDKNFALFKNGTTVSASSNESSAKYIADTNIYTQWESIGSNDVTQETLTVTLPKNKKIDRLLLVGINLKKFQIQYDASGTLTDFTNVVGVNGVTSAKIDESGFDKETAYYEFDEITTDKIVITMDTTQTADAEKEVRGFYATREIGTFEGYPRVRPTADRNEKSEKTLSSKLIVQKSFQTTQLTMRFKTHPYQNDLDIIETLFDREEPFLVYPCGGRTGTDFFKLDQMTWRLKDIFNMQFTRSLKNEWEKGVYLLGFNKRIRLEEHV